MVNWESFKQKLLNFNNGKQSGSLEETAIFYSNLYYTNVINASLLLGNVVIISPAGLSILYDGFLNFFSSNITLQSGTIDISKTIPLANAIIDFWKIQTFSPLPPHPPATLPAPGVVIDFYGEPNSIASLLLASFITGISQSFVDLFTNALKIHLTTIRGNYYGTIPNPSGPIPVIVSWIGVY